MEAIDLMRINRINEPILGKNNISEAIYVDSETILQSNNIGKASFLSATPFLLAICKNNNLLFTNARHLSIAIRILKESATIN